MPPPATRSRAGAIVALVIGALLTVAGPVLGILIGSFWMVPVAIGYGESTVVVTPSATVDLDAGASVLLLAPVAELEGLDAPTCTARAAGGPAADVSFEPATALNTMAGGVRYESFARVTAVTSDAYTIACDTSVKVIAAPPFALGDFFGPLVWWTIGGLGASVVGIALVIVGIVGVTRVR